MEIELLRTVTRTTDLAVRRYTKGNVYRVGRDIDRVTANRLINSDAARRAGVEQKPVEPSEELPELSGMTKAQLLEFAESRGIETDKRLNKSDLLTAIEDGLTAPADERDNAEG